MEAVGLTWEKPTTIILQSGQREYYLVADMQRLRSETRDGVVTMSTERWDQLVIQVRRCYRDKRL